MTYLKISLRSLSSASEQRKALIYTAYRLVSSSHIHLLFMLLAFTMYKNVGDDLVGWSVRFTELFFMLFTFVADDLVVEMP